MAKKHTSSPRSIDKTLTIAGIVLVVFCSIASLFYTYHNRSFLYEPSSLIYYLNYLIILGGGFVAGCLLAGKGSRGARLFIGSIYALIASSVYSLVDALRLLIRPLLDSTPGVFGFPGTLEGLIFIYTPLIALACTILLALLFQFRSKKAELTRASKMTLLLTFFVAQLYNVGYLVYLTSTSPAASDASYPFWFDIVSVLINPLFIALVAFLVFGRVKSLFQRLFYAASVASIMSAFSYAIWNFRIDPTLDATNNFQIFAYALIALLTSFLIWTIRRNAKS